MAQQFSGPGFDSQRPHGCSQLAVTSVSGCLLPSSGLQGHQACVYYVDIHVDGIPIHIKLKKEKKNVAPMGPSSIEFYRSLIRMGSSDF